MIARRRAILGIVLLTVLLAAVEAASRAPLGTALGSGGMEPRQAWCSLYEGDGFSSPSTEGWTVRAYGGNTITGAVSDGATVAIVDDGSLTDGAWLQRYMDFQPPFNISARGRYDLTTPRTDPFYLLDVFTGTHSIVASLTPTTISIGAVPVLTIPATRGWYNITFEVRAILDVDVVINGVFAGNVEMRPSDLIIWDQTLNKPIIATLVTLIQYTAVGMVDYVRTTMCPPTEVPAKVPDRTPPETRDALFADGLQTPAADLAVLQGSVSAVWLNATVDDTGRGGSTIWSANATVGDRVWPGTPMAAADGAFDSVVEPVTTTIDISALLPGAYRYCVYGRDYYGNRDLVGSCATLRIVYVPRIVAVLPLPGATQVPRTTPVVVAFSAPMNATVTAGAFSVSGPAGAVSGSVAWVSGNETLVFTTAAPLLWSATYTASVSAAARDADGTPLWEPYTWSFETEPAPGDTTPPWVVATTPRAGARGVPFDQEVLVIFSEPMELVATADAFSLSGPAGPVPGTVTWLLSGTILSFRPSDPLEWSTNYTATVATGARDLAGNRLQQAVTWSFSTASAPLEPAVNWKPAIALLFTVVLEAVAILVARRVARRPGGRWVRPLTVGAVFSVAELVTGLVSMAVPLLAVPPLLGAGLVVDLVLLLAGLATVLLVARAEAQETAPPAAPPQA